MTSKEYLEKIISDHQAIEFPDVNRAYIVDCPYCGQAQGRQMRMHYPEDFGMLSHCPLCKKPLLLVCLQNELVAVPIEHRK